MKKIIRKGVGFGIFLILIIVTFAAVFINVSAKSRTTYLPFEDDFEENTYSNWIMYDGTSISTESGNLDGTGNYILRLYGEYPNYYPKILSAKSEHFNLQNYILEYDMKFKSNDAWSYSFAHFGVQSNSSAFYFFSDGYELFLNSYENEVILKKIVSATQTELERVSYSISRDFLYHVKIYFSSGIIKCYLNDELLINVSDSTFLKGSFGFGAATGGGTWTHVTLYLDNIKVSSHTQPSEQQTETLFEDDFSSDLNKWALWGSPQPYIDSDKGNPSPSMQINGDSMYNSGTKTKVTFNYSKELIIEADLKIINIGKHYNDAGFGLLKQSEIDEKNHDWHIGIWLWGYEGSINLHFEDESTKIQIPDENWHKYKISICSKLKGKFYIDNILVWEPNSTCDLQYNNNPLVIFGRHGWIDNVKVMSIISPQPPKKTNLIQLTTDASNDYSPDWSWANNKIVFISDRDGSKGIWTINPNGTNLFKVTSASNAMSPRWSPEGNKILYWDGYLYIINSDGTSKTKIEGSSHNAHHGVSWSPNTNEILYIRQEPDGNWDYNNEVFKADISSNKINNEIRLTNDDAVDQSPDWSPDKTKIVWESEIDSKLPQNAGGTGEFNIYVMNSDGSNKKQLTNTLSDYQPRWSPNGTKIAFSSKRDGDYDIYIMDSSGNNLELITIDSKDDSFPAWSLDGEKIVFTSNRNGNNDIWILELREPSDQIDSDNDGLLDSVEDLIGSDKNKQNTDGDLFETDGEDPLPIISLDKNKIKEENPLLYSIFLLNCGTQQATLEFSVDNSKNDWVKFSGNKFIFEPFGSDPEKICETLYIFIDVFSSIQDDIEVSIKHVETGKRQIMTIPLDVDNIIATDFDISKNGYCFDNKKDDFGEYWSKGGGGYCYGMSETSILYFNNDLTLPQNVPNTYYLSIDENTFKIINRYQHRLRDVSSKELNKWFKNMNENIFYKEVKNNIALNTPVLILMKESEYSISEKHPGHAAVAYKVIEDDSKGYIYIYDPSYSFSLQNEFSPFDNSIRYIEIDLNTYSISKYEMGDWTFDEFIWREPSLINGPSFPLFWLFVFLDCPVDMIISDDLGRNIGTINGVLTNQIPSSECYIFDDMEVFILPGNINYTYKIFGTNSGTYNLTITSSNNNYSFRAFNISTSKEEVHVYSINWNELKENKKGVKLKIDSNNDGIFEHSFYLGKDVTGEDIENLIEEEKDKEKAEKISLNSIILGIIIIVIILILIVAFTVSWKKKKIEQMEEMKKTIKRKLKPKRKMKKKTKLIKRKTKKGKN